MAVPLAKASVRQSVKTLRSTRSARGNQMFDRLLSLLLELLFYATGSSVLQLFGWKDPSETASWLTGLALWMLAGLAILVLAAL
jgi:hypothetical protein